MTTTRDWAVQIAIDTWSSRFIARGVDANDVTNITRQIYRWEDWLKPWYKVADMHMQLGQEAEALGRMRTAGEAYIRATLCYHFAKYLWTTDINEYIETTKSCVEALRKAHRYLDPQAQRLEIPFEGTKLLGNLRRPPSEERPPLVLLIPGLDSTKEEFFNWENVYLARGMATFSLDGPGQGETGFTTYIRPDYEVAVTAALDYLTQRTDLDLQRVGIVGVSLGGYYAPRAAAFEPRLKAAASVGVPYDMGVIWSNFLPMIADKFMYHSNSQSAEQAQEKASKLTLEGLGPRIKQPLLLIQGGQDKAFPPDGARRFAAEAPNATLMLYPDGDHCCTNLPYLHTPLVADWMKEMLQGVG